MKHQKPLAVRIFIRICVVFMTISLIWVYVVYMFSPNQEAGEPNEWNDVNVAVEEVEGWSEEQLILPEIDSENPENTSAPILVTEDGEVDEMNIPFQVQLWNGETELVTPSDLWDSIQIAQ